jgi:hypothetical protein
VTPRRPTDAKAVGLPPRVFLYTLDQVALMLSVAEARVKNTYVYYEGRSTGFRSVDLMLAVNIAKRHEAPEWRISEREFIRWLTQKGFKVYEVGGVVDG